MVLKSLSLVPNNAGFVKETIINQYTHIYILTTSIGDRRVMAEGFHYVCHNKIWSLFSEAKSSNLPTELKENFHKLLQV